MSSFPLPSPARPAAGTSSADVGETRRDSDKLLALILDTMEVGIAVLGAQQRLIRVNSAFCRMHGYPAEELLGQEGLSLLHPDDRDAAMHLGLALLAGNTPVVPTEWRILRKDGTVRHVHLTVARFESADGEPALVFAVTDITERKQAEAALREREQFIEGVFRAIPDSVFVYDLVEQRVVYSNRQVVELLGYTPEQLAAMGNEMLPRLLHPEDLPRARQSLADWADAAEGEAREFEYRIQDMGGRWHWFRNYATVFRRDAAGRPCQIIGSARDITERKRAEEEQRRLEDKLRQAPKLESLGVLAGGIAHDFNNLLTAVLGYTSLAQQETPPGTPQHGYLDQVLQAGCRAAELCQQMLAYAGRGKFVVGPVDLAQVLEELAPFLTASVSRRVTLSFQFTPNLPPVEGDRMQLRQVALNLVLNAAEAIGDKDGIITVRTYLAPYDPAATKELYLGEELLKGTYIALEVTDTGCGMEEATLQRAFEPFFTTKFTGRGLGLAAVLGIVRAHHGGVRIESEPGRGTAVHVLLPPFTGIASPSAPAPAERKGLVLFVDDEPQVRALGQAVLRQAGYEVLLASDGPEALELYRQYQAELAAVVLDLTMPHLDGEVMLRALRAISSGVPVLISSGYSEQEASLRFAADGPEGFLSKPYTPRALQEKLQALVQRKGE